jgi:mannose-6-phosphate isomerase-like protein (cupin superfamily)
MSGDPRIVVWRPGVRTRMLASESTGATQLCVFEQWSDPGTGAPPHSHPGVEEALLVLEGECELWIGAVDARLGGGDTALVPPGVAHWFRNDGPGVLHTLAVLPDRAPPVVYDDQPGTVYEIGAVREVMLDAHRAVRPSRR